MNEEKKTIRKTRLMLILLLLNWRKLYEFFRFLWRNQEEIHFQLSTNFVGDDWEMQRKMLIRQCVDFLFPYHMNDDEEEEYELSLFSQILGAK